MSEWHMEARPTAYPDLKQYHVLAPNPDAGKDAVPYAGKDLLICILDNEDDARVVTAAPEMLAALKSIVTISSYSEHASPAHKKIATIARAAIARTKGTP